VLLALCQMSVQNKVKFRKPNIREAGAAFGGDDGEDEFGGDEFEGNADIADMHPEKKGGAGDSEDDIDEDLDFGAGQVGKTEQQEVLQQEILQSSIGRQEWMLEVDRVAHRLKINKTALDGKEWRAHMDQTKKYHEAVKGSLPDVRAKLERLSEDVSKALEKIAKKESVLTRSFQG
jgi:hypothetical protein